MLQMCATDLTNPHVPNSMVLGSITFSLVGRQDSEMPMGRGWAPGMGKGTMIITFIVFMLIRQYLEVV